MSLPRWLAGLSPRVNSSSGGEEGINNLPLFRTLLPLSTKGRNKLPRHLDGSSSSKSDLRKQLEAEV